jgi:hypothetical protein
VVPGPGGLLSALPGAGGGLGGGAGRAAGAGTSRIGGALSSLGNLGAANIAKGAGIVGAVMGVVNLASDISSISDRKKKGELTEEQAKTETGGAVGSAAGGAGGAYGGATLGATIGTMLLPGIGTAVGGVLGGVVGGLAGSSVGKNIGEWFATSGKKESDKVREQTAEKQKAATSEISANFGKAAEDLFKSQSKALSAGGIGGLYQNFGTLFGDKKPESKLMTEEAENFKAIAQGIGMGDVKRQLSQSDTDTNKVEKSPMEVMQTELQTLNKNIAEMLKYTKDMTENTKRTMDGIGKLNPNLFAR